MLVLFNSYYSGAPGGQTNPGNNLHVSGLSTRVEDRDLDEVFSKFGRVSFLLSASRSNSSRM